MQQKNQEVPDIKDWYLLRSKEDRAAKIFLKIEVEEIKKRHKVLSQLKVAKRR